MSGYIQDAVDGIASTLVAEATERSYAWEADGSAYGGNQSTVVITRTVSPANRDHSVTITAYDNGSGASHILAVQFKIRTRDERVGDQIESDLRNLFFDRWGGSLGSIELEQSERTSGTSLGQIGGVPYYERTENYAFALVRPTPYAAY